MDDQATIRVPVAVTPRTLFRGKLSHALRPARLVRFALSCAGLAFGASILLGTRLLPTLLEVTAAISALRWVVMLLSSRVPVRLWALLTGTLCLARTELLIEHADGTRYAIPWASIVDAREHRGSFSIEARVEARTVMLLLSKEALERQSAGGAALLRTLLRERGKMR